MGVNLIERKSRQENWTEQNFEKLANIIVVHMMKLHIRFLELPKRKRSGNRT
jgi:hypothetical protein